MELIAVLEAGIDFAEDDVDVTPDVEILARVKAVSVALEKLDAPLRMDASYMQG